MKAQYDRIFFSGDHGCVRYSLVGTQKMAPPHAIFPSDHFGVHSRIVISTAGAKVPAQAAASDSTNATHKRKRVDKKKRKRNKKKQADAIMAEKQTLLAVKKDMAEKKRKRNKKKNADAIMAEKKTLLAVKKTMFAEKRLQAAMAIGLETPGYVSDSDTSNDSSEGYGHLLK
jgi:uncharacterized protein (DUF1800 family)